MLAPMLCVCLLLPHQSGVGSQHQNDCDEKVAYGLVQQSISKLGGQDKILLQLNCYRRVSVKLGDESLDLQEWLHFPDCSKQVAVVNKNGHSAKIVKVCKDGVLWQQLNDDEPTSAKQQGVIASTDSVIQYACRLLVPLLDKETYTLLYRGETQVGGQTVIRVTARTSEHPEVELHFDVESKLLRSLQYKSNTGPLAGKFVERSFREYRDLNGLKYATKSIMRFDGKIFSEDEIVELRLLTMFPKGTFDIPR